MKTFLLSICMLCGVYGLQAQQTAKSLTTSWGIYIGFYEFKPYNYATQPTKKFPLIIFLHGTGERGNGTTQLSRVLTHGVPKNCANGSTMTFTVNGVTESFLVLSPQLSGSYGGWQSFYVDEMIAYAKQNLQVDTNRIFLTGLSLGGGGTLEYITENASRPAKLAAVAPVCPSNVYDAGLPAVAAAQLPVWSFHAIDDYTCPYTVTTRTINGINAQNPVVAPLMTLYPNGGHFIWNRVYDESHAFHNPNIYEWFLMQGRGAAAQPNQAPIANAGADVTLTLPVNSFTTTGASSVDPDGLIASYDWSKIDGPANYTITNAAAGNTQIKDLIQGTYRFVLKVIDYRGATSRDTIQVVVNPGTGPNIPPISSAGPDISINQPSTYLSGSYSYDPDGYIIAYDWKQEAGPSSLSWIAPTSMFPTIGNMVGGVYNISLTVFDNLGATTKSGINVVNTQAVLPVEYVYVRGKRQQNRNSIQWATASEQNTDHFEVERSNDGQVFTVIGKIQAAGFSSSEKQYQFADEKSPLTKTMYRLRQVDRDGKFKISKTVILSGIDGGATTSIKFSPNPIKDQVQVTLNHTARGKGHLRVFSLEGKMIHQEVFDKDQNQMVFGVSLVGQKPGIYVVELKVGDEVKEVERIVKQ